MSPRELDPATVARKLEALDELLMALEEVGEVTPHRLARDLITRLAVERILTQVVGIAVAINGHVAAARLGRGPATYADSFDLAARAGLIDADLAARLRGSAGLRNVLEHEYVEIDLARVAAAVPVALEGYRAYVRAVAEHVRGPRSPEPTSRDSVGEPRGSGPSAAP